MTVLAALHREKGRLETIADINCRQLTTRYAALHHLKKINLAIQDYEGILGIEPLSHFLVRKGER